MSSACVSCPNPSPLPLGGTGGWINSIGINNTTIGSILALLKEEQAQSDTSVLLFPSNGDLYSNASDYNELIKDGGLIPISPLIANEIEPFLSELKQRNSTFAQDKKVVIDDEIRVWPNPFYATLNFQLSLHHDSFVRINMRDMLGKEVLKKGYNIISGSHLLSIEDISLPTGAYVIEV